MKMIKSLFKQKKTWLVLVTLGMFFVASYGNAADFYDSFVAECKPDLDYFSFRTVAHEVSVRNLSNISNAMTDLLEKPYECQLPATRGPMNRPSRLISIGVINYWPDDGKGYCGSRKQFSLDLRVNGKSIHTFPAYGAVNRCDNPITHLIEIDPFVIRDCTLPDLGIWKNKEQENMCKYIED